MRNLTLEEIEDILENSGIPVINVQSRDEFDRGHIPGTRNIPVDGPHFLEDVHTLIPGESSPVVIYCGGGENESSRRAVRELEDAGYDDVFSYSGGMKEWLGAGREVESRDQAPAR